MAIRIRRQHQDVLFEIQTSGVKSLRDIAQTLVANGIPTTLGSSWTPLQATAILRRAE